MNQKHLAILELLMDGDFITGHWLSQQLGVSEKTCRNWMNGLIEAIDKSCAQILVKKGKGYKLEMENSDEFDRWYAQKKLQIAKSVPQYGSERIRFILKYLLSQKDYVKRRDLCNALYVSEKTVSGDLKQIDTILFQYHLSLKKSTNGLLVVGGEFEKRQCILNYFYRQNNNWYLFNCDYRAQSSAIAKIVLETKDFYFTQSGLKTLVDYLVVMKYRMKQGFYVEDHKKMRNSEYKQALRLLERLYQCGQVPKVKEAEAFYIMLYMKGNMLQYEDLRGTDNFIIPVMISQMVRNILDELYVNYSIDMRDDFPFYISLCKHCTILDIRIRYGIQLENPMLENIRQKYVQSYLRAQVASKTISQYYRVKLSETEVGYIALLFEMCGEDRDLSDISKSNILLVCPPDELTSQYLFYMLKHRFGKFVGDIKICGLKELQKQNFADIDYVLSAIPVNRDVPVPIIMIHEFMTDEEMEYLETKMKHYKYLFLKDYLNEALFFTDIEGKTKEEIIENLCIKINEHIKLPDGFYEAVIQREQMGNTDLGYHTAIPHPCRIMTDVNIVAAAVLKQPVFWHQQNVRVVILSALCSSQNQNNKEVFACISRLITDQNKIEKLIQTDNYENFLNLLMI